MIAVEDCSTKRRVLYLPPSVPTLITPSLLAVCTLPTMANDRCLIIQYCTADRVTCTAACSNWNDGTRHARQFTPHLIVHGYSSHCSPANLRKRTITCHCGPCQPQKTDNNIYPILEYCGDLQMSPHLNAHGYTSHCFPCQPQKTDNNIYLILEYCEGGDLQRFIKARGRLTESVAQAFMAHLAAGLKFLWERNLIHRDLKPQNLLLAKLPGE